MMTIGLRYLSSRQSVAIGGLCVSIGYLLCAFADRIEYLIVAQGVLTGKSGKPFMCVVPKHGFCSVHKYRPRPFFVFYRNTDYPNVFLCQTHLGRILVLESYQFAFRRFSFTIPELNAWINVK